MKRCGNREAIRARKARKCDPLRSVRLPTDQLKTAYDEAARRLAEAERRIVVP